MIFGAGGFIGANLTTALNSKGYETIPISSKTPGIFNSTTGLLSETFNIPTRVDTIFYLSQSPFYRNAIDNYAHMLAVNVTSPTILANMARKAGVRRFIYASTGNVYRESFNPHNEASPVRREDFYALSKLMAEEALNLYAPDLEIIHARIFGVYGPGQQEKLIPNLVNRILNNKEVLLEPSLQELKTQDIQGLKLSLINIRDLIVMLTKFIDVSIEASSSIINLSGPEVSSIRQICNLIARHLNLSVIFKTSAYQRTMNLISDSTKQYQLLGTPNICLEEGLHEYCQSLLLNV